MKQDILADLSRDHRKVEKLFARYRPLRGAGGVVRKRTIFDEVRRELSIHAAAEEQVLYPAVRNAFNGGEKCADAGLEEHGGIKQTLAALQGIDPAAGDFDRNMSKLIREVDHHVKEEEREIFPRLRRHVERKRLVELGDQLRAAKRLAPTRAHPLAPDKPPVNIVAGMIAGAVDRLRDALSALTEAPPRAAPTAGRARRAKRSSSTRSRSRKRAVGVRKSALGKTRTAARKKGKAVAAKKSRPIRKSARRRARRR